MHKKKVAAFLAAGAILVGAAGTYAAFIDSVSVNNHISTGIVDIDLKEYAESGSGLKAYKDPDYVLPGDRVSKIPRITNKGEACWIRAKIEHTGASETLEGLTDTNISGMTDDWVKAGEYYYYTKILEPGESTDLFTNVSIPESWTEEHAEQLLAIMIRTDAIQSANFTPDFSALSPWGNEEIELAVKEQNGKIQEKQQNVKLSVTFDGDAHKLVAAPDDFFENFTRAMPGDVFKDTIDLSNTTGNSAELFFRTALPKQDEEQADLLEKLNLTISMDGKTIYEGNLRADDLNNYIPLGTFASGQSGKMEFMVSVPKELKNVYALRDADVQWIFTVREQEPEESGETPDNGSPASSHGDTSTAAPVKTADESKPASFAALLLLSLTGTGLLIHEKCRTKAGTGKGGENSCEEE